MVAKDSKDTTLTGRQWGIGPRLGFAWSPYASTSKIGCTRRHGLLLRPRRALHVSLSRLRGGRGAWRALRREPDAAFRELADLQYGRCQLLHGVYSHLRLQPTPIFPCPGDHRLAPRPPARPPTSRNTCPTPTPSSMERTLHHGRLRPAQQAALLDQLHARHSVAAAQRSGHRDRLRGQPGPPPGDSHALQSIPTCHSQQSHSRPVVLLRLYDRGRHLHADSSSSQRWRRAERQLHDEQRGRQRGPARAVYRLFVGVDRLPGGRHLAVQRGADTRGQAHGTRLSGRRFLHLLSRH